MSTTLLLARRNLASNRVRLLISIGGIAFALTLTLALDGIYAGVANQLTTYIDRSGADIWIAQAGVRNLHMVASWLPESVTAQVRTVDGVADAIPILYSTDTIDTGSERAVVYVIGLPAGAPLGGPWEIVEGATRPGAGEIIVDRGVAQKAGVGLGDTVTVLGRGARIVGLSEGTATLLNSVVIVPFDDFRATRAGAPVVSFVLVRIEPGASSSAVAAEIERHIPGVTVQSSASFADAERRLVMDMSADVIGIMSGIGFMVALAVVALTVYVATYARMGEYGALKAFGAPNRFLYRLVAMQALIGVAAGFLGAIVMTGFIGLAIGRTDLRLDLAMTAGSLWKVGLSGLVIAGLAAVLPIRQMARLDPAAVFRRGVAL